MAAFDGRMADAAPTGAGAFLFRLAFPEVTPWPEIGPGATFRIGGDRVQNVGDADFRVSLINPITTQDLKSAIPALSEFLRFHG